MPVILTRGRRDRRLALPLRTDSLCYTVSTGPARLLNKTLRKEGKEGRKERKEKSQVLMLLCFVFKESFSHTWLVLLRRIKVLEGKETLECWPDGS